MSLAFGLTVLTAAYAPGPISGRHFNPAVSVGLWTGGRFPLANGFASNGYGPHRPGGFSMFAGMVREVALTFMFLMVILGVTHQRAPIGWQEWRDTHFRVQGPVVAQMQSVFLDNWMRATGRVLHGEAYFPALQPAGDHAAQMFSSSPSGGSESMQLMYLLAITAARKTIDLSNSYFVPDEMTIQTLLDAARRGVRVRVITPSGHIDSETVRKASRGSWGPMLEAGIQIAEYAPTMYHVKSLVVDGTFSSVGSTNFDNRSFRLNDEANLNVLSAQFGQVQMEVFERDWAKARRITLQQWRDRPLGERLLEQLARLLHKQL